MERATSAANSSRVRLNQALSRSHSRSASVRVSVTRAEGTGGSGPPVVFLHGDLMNGTLRHDIVDRVCDRCRCIVPDLPFGAHRTPMPDDAELTLETVETLETLVKMVADFLAELDLRGVTVVCNDWGGDQWVVSPGGYGPCRAPRSRLLRSLRQLSAGLARAATLRHCIVARWHLPDRAASSSTVFGICGLRSADSRRSAFATVSFSAGSSPCATTAPCAAILTSICAASRRGRSCLIGRKSNVPLSARFWSCGPAKTS